MPFIYRILLLLTPVVLGVTAHADDAQESRGFVSLFDGKTMAGWVGNVTGYEAKDGVLTCLTGKDKGGKIFTEKEYDNFILRFEFKLTPGANNGLALRCPLEGKPHGKGFESQILDNTSKRYSKLKDSQYHGSLYKLVAAKRGFLKPVGEWNRQEVMMIKNHVKITLNGEVILEDADISRFRRPRKGHLGFLGHGSTVHFRNIKIKELTP
jgi:hypothetical protein